MTRLTLILCLFFSSQFLMAQESFTLYLVRHAEKELDTSDEPDLTYCGFQRADWFAKYLKDEPIEMVHSTKFLRTMHTARPTADQFDLGIQEYAPNDLGRFAEELLNDGQNALVVGHSNTTGVLAGILANEEGKLLEILDSEYDKIFVVTVSGNDINLVVEESDFECQYK